MSSSPLVSALILYMPESVPPFFPRTKHAGPPLYIRVPVQIIIVDSEFDMQNSSGSMDDDSRGMDQAINQQVTNDDDSLDSTQLYEEHPSEVLRESSTKLFGTDDIPARFIREILMDNHRLVCDTWKGDANKGDPMSSHHLI